MSSDGAHAASPARMHERQTRPALSLQDAACAGLSHVTSRRTRSMSSSIGDNGSGALKCSPNPLPVMTLPPAESILKKGILKKGATRKHVMAREAGHPTGSVFQEARNQLLRTLAFQNEDAALVARLTMAYLEGRLEGLYGPARQPAGRELSEFFAELLADCAPQSVPTTCVQHGPIDKAARKFDRRGRCVCALHRDVRVYNIT